MDMRAHRTIRLALLFLAFAVVVAKGDSAGITCVGREPGYYADPGSQCHRYLLCSPSTVLGIQFSCPPGTKFQQRSLVCDHENNVQCGEIDLEDEEEVLEVEEEEVEEEPRRKREKK